MEDLKAIIESLLFVADKPMSVEKLADVIEEADTKAIRAALQELLGEFDNPGRGFRLREVAGGYQFRTHPECQAYIKRMLKPAPARLSRAALETLAIIAYKQPIIRSDVEHIRGVDSGGVLRVLMEKKLVRVLGRREIPGRPLIYATTKHFLEVFDLKTLKDLPTPKEIEELTAHETEPLEHPEPVEAGTAYETAAQQDPPQAEAALGKPAAGEPAASGAAGGAADPVPPPPGEAEIRADADDLGREAAALLDTGAPVPGPAPHQEAAPSETAAVTGEGADAAGKAEPGVADASEREGDRQSGLDNTSTDEGGA